MTPCANCGAVVVVADGRQFIFVEEPGPIQERDGHLARAYTVSWSVSPTDDELPDDPAEWLASLGDDDD